MRNGVGIIWGTFLLLVPGLAAAKPTDEVSRPPVGVGADVTAGTRGYHKITLYGDGQWTNARLRLDPYVWGEFDSDNYVGEFTFGGGVWKNLANDYRVKGGLGLTVGRIHPSGESDSSFIFETGADKYWHRSLFGADYRLTSGTIGGSEYGNGNNADLHARFNAERGNSAQANAQPYTYNELSAYAKFPLQKTVLGFRLTLGLPSYDRAIVDETVSLKVPITKPLSFTTAATLEQQAGLVNAYFSAGVYYYFK